MSDVVSLDYETYYDQECSVTKLGNWAYMRHPDFDPYLISVADDTEAWAGHPRDFNWDALEGKKIVTFNKGFDFNVYNWMVEQGTAPAALRSNSWNCASNLSSFLCNRRSLDEAAEFLLGIKVSKTIRSWMKSKRWSDAVTAGKDRELLSYARGDAANCQQLWTKYSAFWPEFEQRLSRMTYEKGDYGICIDQELLEQYIRVTQAVLIKIECSLPWMKSGGKPTSPKAIAEECRKVGIPSPPVKSREGEEAFDLWEMTYASKFDWVAAVANWRSVNKFLGSLETIKARLRPDGTMGFSLKYFGAHTGRWSGDTGFNMQNLRKDPIYVDAAMLPVTDSERLKMIFEEKQRAGAYPSWVIDVLDIRKLFIARPGKKFIIADLSQIEPRCLAWLCGDEAFLAKVREGFSVYEAHYRATSRWSGGVMKKENPTLYKTAKAERLGLGYGCGPDKFIVVAKTLADLDVTQEESEKIVGDFRRDNPKIAGDKGIWRTLDNLYRQSQGGNFELQLPSGRTMTYRNVRREVRSKFDPETKQFKKNFVYTAEARGRREIFYGGLLTENLTQATARDIFGEHLLALDDGGFCPIFHVHDEAINEVDMDVTCKDVEQVMSKTPDWIAGCPVASEAVESHHYLK